MKALSLEPKIIAMANALRLDAADPVEGIMQFCRARIASMLTCAGSVRTIWDLERIVCNQLNLVIQEVWTDDQLKELAGDYVAQGEVVFAALPGQLDADTYGILVRRNTTARDGSFQYVAVVDCRGDKAARRFFTRWHEIAHCLTAFDQYELPLRRTTITAIEKDPIEKLTDMIAGDVGFFDPLFRPVLDAAILPAGKLTFDVVENIRAQFCPDASFQATLNACVARFGVPAVVLEAGLGLKLGELRALHSPQASLFPEPKPTPRLRVFNAVSNAAARRSCIQIPRNMRVPDCSIISAVFNASEEDGDATREAVENLSAWVASDGSGLPAQEVSIHAKRVCDRVFAIIAVVDGSLN